MDPNIHAALVGGVLGGAVVVLGIGLTEWLQRRRDAWRDLRTAVSEIVITLPIALSFISTDPPKFLPPGTALGMPGWEFHDRLQRALYRADEITRRFHFIRRGEVRREIDLLLMQ